MKAANLHSHKVDTFQKVNIQFLNELAKVMGRTTDLIINGDFSTNEPFLYQELSRDYQIEGLQEATWP